MEFDVLYHKPLQDTKNSLCKEYFLLKRKIQSEETNEDIKTQTLFLSVYEIMDKQFLFIQELYNQYDIILSEFSYRKMMVKQKAEIMKEVHHAVLNRLLEKNYTHENQLKNYSDEIEQLKKFNKILIEDTMQKEQVRLMTKLKEQEVISDSKKKKISSANSFHDRNGRTLSPSTTSTATSNTIKYNELTASLLKGLNNNKKNISLLSPSRIYQMNGRFVTIDTLSTRRDYPTKKKKKI